MMLTICNATFDKDKTFYRFKDDFICLDNLKYDILKDWIIANSDYSFKWIELEIEKSYHNKESEIYQQITDLQNMLSYYEYLNIGISKSDLKEFVKKYKSMMLQCDFTMDEINKYLS